MFKRIETQTYLETLLGSRNVYWQPPENLKLEYPAIVYSRGSLDNKTANNKVYFQGVPYDGVVISKDPEIAVIEKLSLLNNVSMSKPYVFDGLHHIPFTITV